LPVCSQSLRTLSFSSYTNMAATLVFDSRHWETSNVSQHLRLPVGSHIEWNSLGTGTSLRGTVIGYSGYTDVIVFIDAEFHAQCIAPAVCVPAFSMQRAVQHLLVRVLEK
jgi:hypothetical protein